MKKAALLILICALGFSCNRESNVTGNDIFIFGIYNGFCAQNCSNLFKLQEDKLYADDMDEIRDFTDLKFQDEELANDKFQVAKNAYDDLPQDLFNQSETSFGCPGCVDQDIIYLSYFDGADTWEWRIDTDEEALPTYLADYAHKVKDIVDDLKQ